MGVALLIGPAVGLTLRVAGVAKEAAEEAINEKEVEKGEWQRQWQ